jgi:hypothetical protein
MKRKTDEEEGWEHFWMGRAPPLAPPSGYYFVDIIRQSKKFSPPSLVSGEKSPLLSAKWPLYGFRSRRYPGIRV